MRRIFILLAAVLFLTVSSNCATGWVNKKTKPYSINYQPNDIEKIESSSDRIRITYSGIWNSDNLFNCISVITRERHCRTFVSQEKANIVRISEEENGIFFLHNKIAFVSPEVKGLKIFSSRLKNEPIDSVFVTKDTAEMIVYSGKNCDWYIWKQFGFEIGSTAGKYEFKGSCDTGVKATANIPLKLKSFQASHLLVLNTKDPPLLFAYSFRDLNFPASENGSHYYRIISEVEGRERSKGYYLLYPPALILDVVTIPFQILWSWLFWKYPGG